MRVAVYPEDDYEALDNYDLPPEEAARRYAEEVGDTDMPVNLCVVPIDGGAQALLGWKSDEDIPQLVRFVVTPETKWRAVEIESFDSEPGDALVGAEGA